MGIVFTKVMWRRWKGKDKYNQSTGYESAVEITSFVDWDVKAGLEVKTNVATFHLKNPQCSWCYSNEDIIYSSSSTTTINYEPFRIGYNDIIEVYVDSEPIDITYRGNSSQLIFRGYVQEFGESISENKRTLQYKCVDVTSYLLNRIWSYDHDKADNLTAPQLIDYLVRAASIDDQAIKYGVKAGLTNGKKWDGTYLKATTLNGALGDDTNGNTTVDGKQAVAIASSTNFETENGIITIGTEQIEYEYVSGNNLVGITRAANRSTRASHTNGKATYKSGYIQSKTDDGSEFDIIGMTSNFIPVYEWLKKISERNMLTYNSGANKENRSYTFYVDCFGYIHWFYPYNSTDYDLVEGQNRITSLNLNKTILKVYNMIIFEAGQDCSGRRMMSYAYNSDSEEKELKIKFEAQPDIANALKNSEFTNFGKPEKWSGGSTPTSANYKQNDNAYPDSWPSNYKATWDTTFVTYTNTTYNTTFRAQAIAKGKRDNIDLMKTSLSPLWTGTIEMIGDLTYVAGDLINFTGISFNLTNQPLRITDVSHKVSARGWYTSLTLEEDPLIKSVIN